MRLYHQKRLSQGFCPRLTKGIKGLCWVRLDFIVQRPASFFPSLRCQSLLYLKLYKMRRHELLECQKVIGEQIQKAAHNSGGSQGNSPGVVVNANGVVAAPGSPTPSPAGSEGSVCSKSSGYTSAGESAAGRSSGVLTPPASSCAAAASSSSALSLSTSGSSSLLSVPHSVMQMQHQLCSYLSQCHELWEMADLYASRGRCEGRLTRSTDRVLKRSLIFTFFFLPDFLIHLNHICGFALTLHSSMKDLVKYTQKGLDSLSKEEATRQT